jgi:hypothetical protein
MGCTVSTEDCEVLVGCLVQNISICCKPQHVADVMWALCKFRAAAPSTHQQLHPSTVQLLEELPSFVEAEHTAFTHQNISDMAMAAATLDYHVAGLMAALVAAARPKLDVFRPQDLANLVWALAVQEPMESEQVFLDSQRIVVVTLRRCSARDVGNIAWAYSVVLGQGVGAPLATELLQRAVKVRRALAAEGKLQLYSLVMLLPAEVTAMLRPEVQHLVDQCRTRDIAAVKELPPSVVQRQVVEAMDGGLQPGVELFAEGGLLCIGIAVLDMAGPGHRVAVEVYGSSGATPATGPTGSWVPRCCGGGCWSGTGGWWWVCRCGSGICGGTRWAVPEGAAG